MIRFILVGAFFLFGILFSTIPSCESQNTKERTPKFVKVTEENDQKWIIVNRDDVVVVQLRIYEDRPLRWKAEQKSNLSNGYEIFRPLNWIPGDPSYEIFRYKIDRGARRLVFNSEVGKIVFIIGMNRWH